MKAGRFLGTIIAPRATFDTLANAPPRAGAVPVVAAAMAWAALSLVLAANGESPSRPAPFIAAESHYLVQAAFVLPLFVVGWLVLGAVAGRVAGSGATAVLAPLGYAYGVPLMLTWALPDAIALGVVGFEGLAPLVRLVAPATALYTLFLSTSALRSSVGCTGGRAFVAALAGLSAQALLGAWALR